MMGKYEKLYESGASEADVEKIKKDFAEKSGITAWEDYYWAVKCIVKYDTDDFNPQLMSTMINNSLKYGLTYKTNKKLYLDAIKMLASIYALVGRYELVLNCLNSVIELDDNAPDWVFHDLVSAQNRTRSIKKNLKRPAMFLSDLSRNDGNKPETAKKQTNIFKEFLAAGIIYIAENPKAIVDIEPIANAARKYGLIDTKEWIVFANACEGNVPEKIKNRAEQIVQEEELDRQSEVRAKEPEKEMQVKSRPLVISLFSESKIEEDSESVDEKKQGENQVLKSEVELGLKEELIKVQNRYQEDKAEYERKLIEKDKNIEKLKKKVKSAEKDSGERADLEEQLASEQQMRKNYEQKLRNAEELIEKSVVENKTLNDEKKNLKNELTVAHSRHQEDKAEYERKLIEKDKNIDELKKKIRSTEKGSSEKTKLEEQLASEQQKRKQAEEQTRKATDENKTLSYEKKSLKDELTKEHSRHQEDKADYERKLIEKDKNIEELKRRVHSAEKGSSEKKKLEELLASEQQKRKQAEEQIQRLTKVQKTVNRFSADSAEDIIGDWKRFEVMTTKHLASWLTNQLLWSRDGWDKYIMQRLSAEQNLRAKNYETLEEFDLAALLRIFSKNWKMLKQLASLPESGLQIVNKMFDVRNKLAHSNGAPLNTDKVVKDLKIMSKFLIMIGFSTDAGKIAKYAEEVAATMSS